MTIFESFCEEYENEYTNWLNEKEFEDTDEAKETFAYIFAGGLAFGKFEYNYGRMAAGE